MIDSLQQREIFHLEFLRALNRTLKPEWYVLKGGTDLRFFFGSVRYSEDLDIDVKGITVSALKDKVMAIIQSPTLNTILRPFNIGEIIPPDLGKAKQTQTVQRFKVHLITTAGEDLFTKIEFSRKGFEAGVKTEMVTPAVTRFYKSAPLIVPHYSLETAARQKIRALADRKEIQARDLFDLFILHNRVEDTKAIKSIPREKIAVANKNILSLTYGQYRDTVVTYLSEEDQPTWSSEAFWDEIRLRTSAFLENLLKEYE